MTFKQTRVDQYLQACVNTTSIVKQKRLRARIFKQSRVLEYYQPTRVHKCFQAITGTQVLSSKM